MGISITNPQAQVKERRMQKEAERKTEGGRKEAESLIMNCLTNCQINCQIYSALPHLVVTLSSGITNSGKDNCKTLLFAEEPQCLTRLIEISRK